MANVLEYLFNVAVPFSLMFVFVYLLGLKIVTLAKKVDTVYDHQLDHWKWHCNQKQK